MRAKTHIRRMTFLQSRWSLPLAVVVFLFVALGLPAIRLRLRHGEWGIVVHRGADDLQATMGVGLAALLLAVGLGAGFHAARGPEALGVWPAPTWVAAAGWSLAVAGLSLVAIAQREMGRSWRVGIDDRPTSLVDTGIFALVRNPIYSGLLAMVGGVALIAPCAWTVCLGLMTLMMLSLQTRLEERHLAGQHGESFVRYAARVGRFVPGFGRLDARRPGRVERWCACRGRGPALLSDE
jgi:protein-S-isoprenylcysteine O-methyltransferase Ste14